MAQNPCNILTHGVRMIMRRCQNNPKLHEKSLLMIWRQLGPQSPRKPLVTHYAVMAWNLAASRRSPSSTRHMCRPVLGLPVNMIQRRLWWKCCDWTLWHQLSLLRKAEYEPKNTIPTAKHGGGNIMFLALQCQHTEEPKDGGMYGKILFILHSPTVKIVNRSKSVSLTASSWQIILFWWTLNE